MGDRVRQASVTAAWAFSIVGTLVGTGVIGTRVEESSGGALAEDATLLAPAGPAFTIWSIIYAGLAAYTVWQWLPAQTRSERHRAIGWWAALSMVLNATWLLVTQQGWIWFSVVVIVALAANLILLVRRLEQHRGEGIPEKGIVDGTFGLYLGWVCVAVAANLAAASTESDLPPGTVLAVTGLLIVAAGGAALLYLLGARWAVAVALTWGLGWIAIGRLDGERYGPESVPVGIAALAAAAIILVAIGYLSPSPGRGMTQRRFRQQAHDAHTSPLH